jgi:hypothetical protein
LGVPVDSIGLKPVFRDTSRRVRVREHNEPARWTWACVQRSCCV